MSKSRITHRTAGQKPLNFRNELEFARTIGILRKSSSLGAGLHKLSVSFREVFAVLSEGEFSGFFGADERERVLLGEFASRRLEHSQDDGVRNICGSQVRQGFRCRLKVRPRGLDQCGYYLNGYMRFDEIDDIGIGQHSGLPTCRTSGFGGAKPL
jgi:hypothetical protein